MADITRAQFIKKLKKIVRSMTGYSDEYVGEYRFDGDIC